MGVGVGVEEGWGGYGGGVGGGEWRRVNAENSRLSLQLYGVSGAAGCKEAVR